MRSPLRLLPTVLAVGFSAVVIHAGPTLTGDKSPPPACLLTCGEVVASTTPVLIEPGMRIRQIYDDDCTPELVFVDFPLESDDQLVNILVFSSSVTSTPGAPLLAVAAPRPAGESGWLTVEAGRPLVTDFDFSSWCCATSTMPSGFSSVLQVSAPYPQPPVIVSAVEWDPADPLCAYDADSGEPLGFRMIAERCVPEGASGHAMWRTLAAQPLVSGWVEFPQETVSLIAEFNLKATGTINWVEMPMPRMVPTTTPPLHLLDPGDLLAPAPGQAPTTTIPFSFAYHPQSMFPTWVPAFADHTVTSTVASGRLWLRVPNSDGMVIPLHHNSDGTEHPHRLWRIDASGEVEELDAVLAFRLLGVATSTPPTSAPSPRVTSISMRIHPSPFQHATTIGWRAPRGGDLRLEVFDLRGRRVRDLSAKAANAEGWLGWDGKDSRGGTLAAGTYVVRASIAGVGTTSAKVLLLK